ncbi:hypothetical protein [Paenibacillus oleatilyticus]|uniref:Uncharacterized protein n=1 Tax=Paenibacillus oleatilyticus TaxID=2594886 RepID=A0ABV4UVG2_9BACL
MLRKKSFFLLLVAAAVMSISPSASAQNIFQGNALISTQDAKEKMWTVAYRDYTWPDYPKTIHYDDGKGWVGTLTETGSTCFEGLSCRVKYEGWTYYSY